MVALDRWLTGLGIGIAIGSVAFATEMIRADRLVAARSARLPAHDIDKTERDIEAVAGGIDEERTGSIRASDRDLRARSPQRSGWTGDERRGPSDPRQTLLSNYILRYADVGAALVQGTGGTLVVVPGSMVPDAGQVRSIENRAGRWVVVTSIGTIEEPPM